MQDVFILVGSPGTGKSWVSSQLQDSFQVIEHDSFKDKKRYIYSLINAAKESPKPILANTPFGLSEIMETLANHMVKARPVFIIEPEATLKARYYEREKKEIPQGHLTRQHTYLERAQRLSAFHGTSLEVLKHLREGI